MEEVEVMNALSNAVGLSSVEIEKSRNESQNLNYQKISVDNKDEQNEFFNKSAENQGVESTVDPAEQKRAVYFNDKTYQPTFQMQPEIVKDQIYPMHDRQFVFGTAKARQENVIKDPLAKESLDLLKRSIMSLQNRDFINFAHHILQSVSKLSIEKIQQVEEIKSKISIAEIDKKLQSFGIKDVEIILLDIEKLLEEILSNEQGVQVNDSKERYIIVIQKLCDILSVLFGQFRDKIVYGGNTEALSSTLPAILPKVTIENDTVDQVNEPAAKFSTENNDITGTEGTTVNGKKICKCFSMNNELDKPSDEPVYANDIEMKTAKSVDFDVIEEESLVPLKSYSSLISTKIKDYHLRKVQNVDDLSKTESSTHLKSKSFIHSKGIDEQPVELQTKYQLQSNVVQVLSIPSIITRHYHAEKLNKDFLSESMHSIKNESMSTAIIEDINDDGFLDLPKVPSTTLSEASSSEWIDVNTSFVNSHYEKVLNKSESKLVPEEPTSDPMPIIPLESLCSVLNEPLLSAIDNPQPLGLTHDHPTPTNASQDDPQPSTSANSKPFKKQKRFSGCKNFVKRFMSNTLLRKKDRN